MLTKNNFTVKTSELIFIRKNVRLNYYPQQQLVIQTWANFVSSTDFREAIDFTLEFMLNNPVKYILSDALKQSAISPKDSAYAAGVMPQMIQSGLKAFAFVIPEDIFTKLSLKKFSDLDPTEKVQYFWDIDEAMQWIKEME